MQSPSLDTRSRRRRVPSFIAAGLMPVLLLAACGGDDDVSASSLVSDDEVDLSDVTIEVLYTTSPLDFGVTMQETFDRYDFDFEVDLVQVEDYDALPQRLQADVAAGSPPAISQLSYAFLSPFIEADLAQPLDDFLASDPDFSSADFEPSLLELMAVDGTTYGMPYVGSNAMMYFNADLFREAGLDPDDPPQTWSELRAAAEQLVLLDGVTPYGEPVQSPWFLQSHVQSNGGSFLGNDGEPGFTDPAFVEVIEFFQQMAQDDLFSFAGDVNDQFLRGEVAMMVTSNMFSTRAAEAPFDLEVAPIPIADDGERSLAVGGNGLMMFAVDEKEQLAAWEVIKMLTSEQGSTIVTEASGYTPVNSVAANGPLVPFIEGDPRLQLAVEQIPLADPWFNWPGERGGEINGVLSATLEEVFRDGGDVPSAMSQLSSEVQDLLPAS